MHFKLRLPCNSYVFVTRRGADSMDSSVPLPWVFSPPPLKLSVSKSTGGTAAVGLFCNSLPWYTILKGIHYKMLKPHLIECGSYTGTQHLIFNISKLIIFCIACKDNFWPYLKYLINFAVIYWKYCSEAVIFVFLCACWTCGKVTLIFFSYRTTEQR